MMMASPALDDVESVPEDKAAFAEVTQFFDAHLGH
jgi:hypothetical protein